MKRYIIHIASIRERQDLTSAIKVLMRVAMFIYSVIVQVRSSRIVGMSVWLRGLCGCCCRGEIVDEVDAHDVFANGASDVTINSKWKQLGFRKPKPNLD